MIDANFEFMSNLQYKLKSLEARVQAFETGERYTAMQAEFAKQLAAQEREIRRLKTELADAHVEKVGIRNNWMQVFEDLEKEHSRALAEKDRQIHRMEARALRAEGQRDEARNNLREKKQEVYLVMTELEEERGRSQKLTAQINRDYENSSIPSSQQAQRKKIANNREKTGKRPGGQPGHEGHRRKRFEPTSRINIPAPEKYANNPDYKATGRTITKQVVGITVSVSVVEYATPEFRNVRTGQRLHADFPEGMVNEVNYDGSVKAFAYLLNNHCNVAVAKVSDFLSELTNGQLKISSGMVNGLSREFARKTASVREEAFAEILRAPVVHVDFTTAKVNGKQVQVLVCATPKQALYFAREHKGHEGVKGTPVDNFMNTLVHDHDLTFYKYGVANQECLEHVLRYLKNSIENEAERKWNRRMQKLIREMFHFRNGLDDDETRNPDEVDPEKVAGFEARYDEILASAEEEYEYEPPSKYFRDGFNLAKKLRKYRKNHLLFLHDIRVPPTNNLAERLLRKYKRKQAQVMTFRNFENLDYLCQTMGTVALLRQRGENLYHQVTAFFDSQVSS